MEQSRRWQNHQQVFSAFKTCLDKIDNLKAFKRQLEYKKELPEQQLFTQAAAMLGTGFEEKIGDYFTWPAEHHIDWRTDRTGSELDQLSTRLAGYYIAQNPAPYSACAILERLQAMLKKPFEPGETDPYSYASNKNMENIKEWYLYPQADDCLVVLLKHLAIPEVKEFLLKLYNGVFDQVYDQGEESYDRYLHSCQLFFDSNREEFEIFAEYLFEQSEFSYEFFQQAARLFPDYIHSNRLFNNIAGNDEDEDYIDESTKNAAYVGKYQNHLNDFAISISQDLPDSTKLFSDVFAYTHFYGIHWLIKGLEKISELKIKPKNLKEYEDSAKTIRRLIAMKALMPGETEDDLLAALKVFDQQTLLTALPYAGAARNTMLRAMDWQALIPLQAVLFEIAGGSVNTVEDDFNDIYNSEDPASGVIDRQRVLVALENCTAKSLDQYFKALTASDLSIKNTIMLIKATTGIDRDKIEKKLIRHGQAAIKAYGLYPVESPEELRQRYLKFKQMHKDAAQYGPERQVNTRAAVQAGLSNLAQTAGYPDAVRMEWDLEADLAATMTPLEQWHDIEDWSVCLTLQGISPRIIVKKGAKLLKSVPPKVRQHQTYQGMREAQEQIRNQARRFRGSLENMMCSGEKIPAQELLTLNRLPVVRGMLTQLIMRTTNGKFGLYTGDGKTLSALDGGTVVIDDMLQIAHPYHLFSADKMPQWQKTIVEKLIVQPFKQAFRELYIVTPAELTSVDTSRRFCGHVVDSAIASRLVQSRGWTLGSDEVAVVYKRFNAQQLAVTMEFPDSRHYLAEEPEVSMDEIWFSKDQQHEKMPLKNIDPLIFSEVMRDADLIAAVAQVTEDDTRWSSEVAQRREELVGNLVMVMGMNNVRCEGHFAYIQGQRANYRIHLGSGVIHIEPGNYLCVIPDDGKKDESLYLPFADTDKKMTEIISKILLLSNDDKIKDKTILAQINRDKSGVV